MDNDDGDGDDDHNQSPPFLFNDIEFYDCTHDGYLLLYESKSKTKKKYEESFEVASSRTNMNIIRIPKNQ